MTKRVGSLGGRDDITLAADLDELGPWSPTGTHYLEADELTDAGEFPTHGYFLEVELLPPGQTGQHYVQVTEGLDGMMVEKMEELNVSLQTLKVEVDVAEKSGEKETDPWRYTAEITARDQPEDESGP